MPANYLTPIIKCAYKKAQQQNKEEAFQDGDFLQKVHQYLSSPDVLENTFSENKWKCYCLVTETTVSLKTMEQLLVSVIINVQSSNTEMK